MGNREKFSHPSESPITGSDSILYAKGFQIETYPDYTVVKIRNPWNTGKWLQTYILVPETAGLPNDLPPGTLIRTPLKRTAAFGSVQCSFFAELEILPTLAGVCEPHYIHIPYVQEGVQSGRIADLGQAANPDIEKIMLIEPEALFTAPLQEGSYGQEAKTGIPVIECMDYMEESPLGRSEWIRFYGLFFDQRNRADSLFAATVQAYEQLKTLVDRTTHHPSVLTETIYNGIWYLPGGNSYAAQLLRDAGAHYLWKDTPGSGSIGLAFEAVLDKAEKADCWLIKYNSPRNLTYRELAQNYANYTFFDAYKKRNIYTCNTGTTLYYEEGAVHPDYILNDLVWIFHPELTPGYIPRYYRKMVE
jgi:iron complex transport system substrate-binding protein